MIVWRWDSAGPGILALLILPGIVPTLSSVRVIAGQAGVRVGLGRWGRPAKVVDYADIASAAVEQISPTSVGGWGHSVKRGTTVVMVSGRESLVLDLRNGRRLAVSCRDAGTGAAFVNRSLTRG
ncbi:hypothetical protein ABZ770_07675 [Streptomyces sp. NPDC006654]|uniref:hypothetical protein n=1 Tax=Streptomyces sp. NPDC006654 TaxID=3156897 RepID=UPI0033C2F42B